MPYLVCMTIDYDSLSRLAHATGMTDVEFDERSQVEAELACQQQIRRRMEDEQFEADMLDLAGCSDPYAPARPSDYGDWVAA